MFDAKECVIISYLNANVRKYKNIVWNINVKIVESLGGP